MTTPPVLSISAVTPVALSELMRSMSAGGKVSSMPNRTPMRFIVILLQPRGAQAGARATDGGVNPPLTRNTFGPGCHLSQSWSMPSFQARRLKPAPLHEILLGHALPPGPIVARAVAPHVQPVRNAFVVQHSGKTAILAQAHVVVAGAEHDAHGAVAVQIPRVVHAGQVVNGTLEIAIRVVVSVEKLLDVERAA